MPLVAQVLASFRLLSCEEGVNGSVATVVSSRGGAEKRRSRPSAAVLFPFNLNFKSHRSSSPLDTSSGTLEEEKEIVHSGEYCSAALPTLAPSSRPSFSRCPPSALSTPARLPPMTSSMLRASSSGSKAAHTARRIHSLSELLPGHHIRIYRPHGGYHHHAIVRSSGSSPSSVEIVQYDAEPAPDLLQRMQSVSVVRTTLNKFLGSQPIHDAEIVSYPQHSATAEQQAAALKSAVERADLLHSLELKGLYDLMACNCEHVATYCATERWASAQSAPFLPFFAGSDLLAQFQQKIAASRLGHTEGGRGVLEKIQEGLKA